MSGWLFLHILSLGVWIGCIATETIVEHGVKGEAQRDYVARIHWPIDLYVETPAFVVVALSGLMLWGRAAPDATLIAKVAAGGLAVLANALCVWVVHARRAARERGDVAVYARLDHIQHKIGGALVILIVVAFGIGLYRH